MTCLTAPAPGTTAPSIAVVRNNLLPQTIGDEWPRPEIGVFHLMFLVGLHSSGRFFSSETPWPRGPRHCGQLSTKVKAQTMRTRANTASRIYHPSAADAIDILFSSNVDASIGNRRRGINRFADGIRAQDLVLWTSLYDKRVAVLTRHENLAVEGNRRSRKRRRNRNAAAFVLDLACLRVDAGQHAAVGCQIEIIAVENRRRNVSRAFRVLPRHFLCTSQIAAAAQANRERDLCRIASHEIDHFAIGHGRRNRVALDALVRPQLFAGRRIVRDDRLGATRDQFSALSRLHEQRCGPTDLHLARRLPNFLARLLVKRDDERRSTVLFISLHDHEVLENDRRRAGAHTDRTHFPEVRFPRELAVEVVSVETLAAEECVDHLAVSRRCRS